MEGFYATESSYSLYIAFFDSCQEHPTMIYIPQDFSRHAISEELLVRLGLLQCSEHPWLVGAVSSTCVFQPPESPTETVRVGTVGGEVPYHCSARRPPGGEQDVKPCLTV